MTIQTFKHTHAHMHQHTSTSIPPIPAWPWWGRKGPFPPASVFARALAQHADSSLPWILPYPRERGMHACKRKRTGIPEANKPEVRDDLRDCHCAKRETDAEELNVRESGQEAPCCGGEVLSRGESYPVRVFGVLLRPRSTRLQTQRRSASEPRLLSCDAVAVATGTGDGYGDTDSDEDRDAGANANAAT